jgi:hypothetical protein
MSEPANDDLLPEHTDIDTSLAAIRREHAERLAAMLNLDAGLTAILIPDEDAYLDEPAIVAPPVSSSVGIPLAGGRAAVIIASRSHALDLAHSLDLAHTLALALSQNRVGPLAVARALAFDRDFFLAMTRAIELAAARSVARDPGSAPGLASGLERILDIARDCAHALILSLDHSRDRSLVSARAYIEQILAGVDRAREYGHALDHTRIRARKHARALTCAHEIRSALSHAGELVRQLGAVEVDASGADLSALDITNMSVLEGVVWTDKTTWPPGVREQVEPPWSREIRPGVYRVQGGNQRDPSTLIIK